jgi:hypothetical protein
MRDLNAANWVAMMLPIAAALFVVFLNQRRQ